MIVRNPTDEQQKPFTRLTLTVDLREGDEDVARIQAALERIALTTGGRLTRADFLAEGRPRGGNRPIRRRLVSPAREYAQR